MKYPPTHLKLGKFPFLKASITICVTTLLTACGGGGTLSVSQGIGGSVSSDDGNINCGTACEYEYDKDTDITLSASADLNYLFLNWTGDCSGSNIDCELTVNKNRNVGTVFNALDDPGIGATFEARAGEVITLNYTGSTDSFDYAGIFHEDAENNQYLERVRLTSDYGTTAIRVPTTAGSYQFRMFNNDYQTIVIDDNLEVLPYNASFQLESAAQHPKDRITVSYSGSTHAFDYLAAYLPGRDGSEYSERVRLTENEGEITFTMPAHEGTYELRMVNNKDEIISSTTSISLSYSAMVSTRSIAQPGEVISVDFSGSTQDYDYIALYAQNASNSQYLDRIRLDNASSGSVALQLPDQSGIYTVRMVNTNQVSMAEHRYVSALSENELALYGAPDLAAPNEVISVAYSGVSGGESIGIFPQGAENSSPISAAPIPASPLGNLTLTAPEQTGYYQLRLLNSAQQTLKTFNYIKVVDPAIIHAEIPLNVSAGETIPVIFSGSSEEFDYLAIYEAGETNPANYHSRIRLTDENGMINFRMPTESGDYVVRLINSSSDILDEGNQFTVNPYNATAVMQVNQAAPTDMIAIDFSGSTNPFDYLAFYEIGAPSNSYENRVRLIEEQGTIYLEAPENEGTYELRMITNNYLTILNAGTIEISYDATFVGGPQFALPGETVSISFNGSTNDFDYVAIYAQEAGNSSYIARERLDNVSHGTVEIVMPTTTGLYDVRMVNQDNVTIQEGEPIAVLDPVNTENFIAPQITSPGSNISIAYSHAETLVNATIGIYEQGATNDAPIQEHYLIQFPIGRANMATPTSAGIYEVRLVDQSDETLATAAYLYIIDTNNPHIFVPDQVRAGETVWVGFSGSDDRFDYAAIYLQPQPDNRSHYARSRLSEEFGVIDMRMPTIAGNYNLRMIDSDYVTQIENDSFTVQPYSATASLASVAQPTESVKVTYTGSTNPFDYVAIYEPGASNANYLQRERLINEAGEAFITMPDNTGSYDVRLVNNKNETITDLGSILVTYDHEISVTAQSIAQPGETITVTFAGSTGDFDYIGLYPQESGNSAYIERVRLAGVNNGDIQLTLPSITGIYDIRMINSGNVTISNNITVSVLDNSATELFIAPEIVAPGEAVSLGYSGSFASSNTAGIYNQYNGSNLAITTLTPQYGNTTITAPLAGGVYDVLLKNNSSQTLASSAMLYVLDDSETTVHGPAVVRAGDTVRFIYAGSDNSSNRMAFFPEGSSNYSEVSGRLMQTSGAINVRVPTIDGNYELRMINSDGSIIANGDSLYIEPYDGDIDPE